jgi:hypothetical protein
MRAQATVGRTALVASKEGGRALARCIAPLERETLPGPGDYEAMMPPTAVYWVRRVLGAKLWLWFAFDDERSPKICAASGDARTPHGQLFARADRGVTKVLCCDWMAAFRWRLISRQKAILLSRWPHEGCGFGCVRALRERQPGAAGGRLTRKVAPRPGSLATEMVPPSRVTIVCVTESPSPVPSPADFVV